MRRTVLAIGRWMPIHLGHKKFLTDLARKFDRLIIGIGSCYENGSFLRDGVSMSRAHSEGILHGAAHTYIYKWEDDELFILLRRRSLNKDSFPGCLDSLSAGHIELGSDFLQTAQKELFEELGLEVGEELFCELFEQRIYSENVFHSRAFIDKEINKIYAIEMPLNINDLELQPSEVSEAVWLSADSILSKLSSGDGELCMDADEMKRAIDILKEENNCREVY